MQLNQPHLQILRHFSLKLKWCKSGRTESARKADQSVTFAEIDVVIYLYISQKCFMQTVKSKYHKCGMPFHLVPVWETPADIPN